MKKKLWLGLLLLAALCCIALSVGAEEAETRPLPVFTLQVGDGSVELHTEVIEEEPWLFLPAFARLDQLSVNGYELEWWDTEADEEGMWYVDILYEEEPLTVYVMRSENLRTLFLFSDDPEQYGRAYIENCSNHQRFTTASMALINTDGLIEHAEKIGHFRGRGNGTWSDEKKSYQLKLGNRVDLLDTGNDANRARTWVLLAESGDYTFLRYRLVTDLARQLGLNVMENEHVDLYYDGEYRGTYLLSEKVEIGEGRVDVLDYEELIEKWNKKVGQYDLEALPVAESTNQYGNPFTYVEGIIEDSRPDIGSYFVEMESIYTLSDRCYFQIEETPSTLYALKNPENASQEMMLYISERFQEAFDTLVAGGVNPVNGHTTEDDFDVDAFARTMIIQEFAYNVDGYAWSSSHFVLPAGASWFEPGPMWDFDLSFGYYPNGDNANAVGFKDGIGWLRGVMTDFYRAPAFLAKAKEVYLQELYPMIQQILFGDETEGNLKSWEARQEEMAAASAMNLKLWPINRDYRFYRGYDLDEELKLLRKFMIERSEWLYQAMTDLQPENEKHLPLWVNVQFMNADDSLHFYSAPWQEIMVDVLKKEQLTEADEENYAVWQLEAVIAGEDGRSLDGCSVTLNGTPLTVQTLENGTLLIRAQYEDQSYRPVDYYGEDVGFVYDYEKYIAAYPEVAEACGYDEQAVLDYFFDEGIYEAHVGNGLFDPKAAADALYYVRDYLYDDWENYYGEFLAWGKDANWMDNTFARFVPTITDVP